MANTNDKLTYDWKGIFLQAALTILIASLAQFLFWFFSLEDIGVAVSTSVQQENGYITIVTIKNLKSSPQQDLNVYVDKNIVVKNISGAQYQSEYAVNSILNIKLFPKEIQSYILLSDVAIEKDSLVAYSEQKIKIMYANDFKRDTVYLLLNTALYLIFVIIFGYLLQRNKLKFAGQWQRIERQMHSLDLEKERNRKLFLYYRIRIRDFKKELDFWHDTIRKLMYNSKDKTNSANEIIDVVRKELKTYTTKSNQAEELDELYYIIKAIENERKDEPHNTEPV